MRRKWWRMGRRRNGGRWFRHGIVTRGRRVECIRRAHTVDNDAPPSIRAVVSLRPAWNAKTFPSTRLSLRFACRRWSLLREPDTRIVVQRLTIPHKTTSRHTVCEKEGIGTPGSTLERTRITQTVP